MISKVLLAFLATAIVAQGQFGGGDDQTDPMDNRPPPRGGQGMPPPRPNGRAQDPQGPPRPGTGPNGPPNRSNSSARGNGMSVIDPNATLMAIITMDPERRRDHCGKWGDWKEVRCWWPDQEFSSLPEECTNITYPKQVPAVLQKFIDGKIQEIYSVIQSNYKTRGSPPKCGHCTHSFKCRTRNSTSDDGMEMGMDEMDDDQDEESGEMNDMQMGMMGMSGPSDPMGRRRPRPRPRPRPKPKQCKKKEIRPIDDASCDDAKACKVSSVGGGCPAPMFLHKDRMKKINEMMMNGDHEGALNAIDSLQYDDDHVDFGDNSDEMDEDDNEMGMDNNNMMRKKRQSGFYDPSNGMMSRGMQGMQGMQGPMQMNGPWYPSDQWMGASQSQNPFLQWRRQERQGGMGGGYGNDMYGPGMGGGYGQGQNSYGGGMGGRGGFGQSQNFYGGGMGGMGGGQGQGGMYGQDDFGGGRFGRQGGQGVGGGMGRFDQMDRFGRQNDDFGGRFGGRGDWDDWMQGGGSGRGGQWGPGGGGSQRGGNMQGPWGPGRGRGESRRPSPWDRDDDRMGPRRDQSREEDPWGRGGRRRPPPPPPPPPRGRDDDSMEERRPRFGPMGMGGMDKKHGHHGKHGHGGHGGRGGKGGKGGKGEKGKFLANLLHGTNCVSSGSDCLCCCGGFIPDAASGDCRDIRQMMPGLDGLLDFAMKPMDPMPPPPMPGQGQQNNQRNPPMNF